MSIYKGLFDAKAVNKGWFDTTQYAIGWFDRRLFDNGAAAVVTYELTVATFTITGQSTQNTLMQANTSALLTFSASSVQAQSLVQPTTAADFNFSAQSIQNFIPIGFSSATFTFTANDVNREQYKDLSAGTFTFTAQDTSLTQQATWTAATLSLTPQDVALTGALDLTLGSNLDFSAQTTQNTYNVQPTASDFLFTPNAVTYDNTVHITTTAPDFNLTPQDVQPTITIALGVASFLIQSTGDIEVIEGAVVTSPLKIRPMIGVGV